MPTSPINQTTLAMAALVACIVQTLDESQAGVRPAFEANLQTMYDALRRGQMAQAECLEILTLARDLLKNLP